MAEISLSRFSMCTRHSHHLHSHSQISLKSRPSDHPSNPGTAPSWSTTTEAEDSSETGTRSGCTQLNTRQSRQPVPFALMGSRPLTRPASSCLSGALGPGRGRRSSTIQKRSLLQSLLVEASALASMMSSRQGNTVHLLPITPCPTLPLLI